MVTSNLLRSENEPQINAAEPIEFIDLKAQQARIRPQLDAAIKRVLDHGQYVMGPEVKTLERELAAFCGAKHAISCSSGTDALLISMMAKNIGVGDAVLCPAFTYTATPESVALLGATPVFVDVDAETFNVDPDGLKAGLDIAVKQKLKPQAVIAVDLFGQPADYAGIQRFAAAHGLWVLSDAAQSFGATLGGRRVGTLGSITATSFFPAKPLGCYGDGGAIFTDDDETADFMRSIRSHGKGAGKYDIVRIGINGRLDTLQAAILIEKLKIFPNEIHARNEIATRYSSALSDYVTVPMLAEGTTSVWAQYTVRIADGLRDDVAGALRSQGIPTQIYYPRSLPSQPAFRHYPVASPGVPVSERLPRTVMSLPMHAYLSEIAQSRIVTAIVQMQSARKADGYLPARPMLA